MNARKLAAGYIRRGLSPIPIPHRAKKCTIKGWTKLRIDDANVGIHFNGSAQNIGVLLGPPSGNLVDVDLDCTEAITLASRFLPPTDSVFGRASKPKSHQLYCTPGAQTEKFAAPDVTCLVELRGTCKTGSPSQTVFPGSTHETGEPIEWAQDGDPAKIDVKELRRAVARLAAAALLARCWPDKGTRHDAHMALAGGLLRGGWNVEDVEHFVEAIATATGSTDTRTHVAAVRPTAEKLKGGNEITGLPRLAELVGAKVVAKVRGWLDLHSDASGAHVAGRVAWTQVLADAITDGGAHFAVDAGRRLYVFRDGVYVLDGETFIRARTKALLNEWGKSGRWSSHQGREVVEYLRVDRPQLLARPPLDRVNLLNGILHIKTRELMPHTPDYLSPVQIPVAFNPGARCPAIEKFVAETFPEDAHDLAWEIPAWLLLPHTDIQKALLLIGGGGNAKSTVLRLFTRFIGSQNIANLSLHAIEANRFASSYLVGKLANICADLPSRDLSSTSMFKALVGNDRIQAEIKHGAMFEFEPHARLLFSANHPPTSADASEAFFRRWLVIPFDRRFEGTNAIPSGVLDKKLMSPGELSGLLNKALACIDKVHKEGLTEAPSMREALADLREVTDPFPVWLDKATVDDPAAFVVRGALIRLHNENAKRNGRPPMTGRGFWAALKRARPGVLRGRNTVAGRQESTYQGIGLRAEEF